MNHELNEAKKRKTSNWMNELNAFGFRNLGPCPQWNFHPNENVSIPIRIWYEQGLVDSVVHVIFRNSLEIIEIENKSFGEYSIHSIASKIRKIRLES